jgi:integrase
MALRLKWREQTKGKPWAWLVGWHGGKRYRESLKTSDRTLALEKFRQRKREIVAGLGQPTTDITFARAAITYMELGGEKRFLAPLIETLGAIPLKDLTQELLSSTAKKLFPKASNATLNRQVYTPAISVYRTAAKDLQVPVRAFSKTKVKKEPVEPISDHELWRLLELTEGVRKLFLLLLTFTGARTGEVLALKWRDLADGFVHYPRTKNSNARQVRLHSEIVACWDGLPEGAPEDAIFPWANKSAAAWWIRKLQIKHDLPRVKLHNIGRHKFAKRFLDAGNSLYDLMIVGGWRTIKIVAETYGHWERKRVDDAVTEVDAGRKNIRLVSVTRAPKPTLKKKRIGLKSI